MKQENDETPTHVVTRLVDRKDPWSAPSWHHQMQQLARRREKRYKSDKMKNDLPADAVKYEGKEVRLILDKLTVEEKHFCSEYCNRANNPKNPRNRFCPFRNEFRPLASLGAINSRDDSSRKKELFNNEDMPTINDRLFHHGIAIPSSNGTVLLYVAAHGTNNSVAYTVGGVKDLEVLDVVKTYDSEIRREMSKALDKS